jgi:hypothetical protein
MHGYADVQMNKIILMPQSSLRGTKQSSVYKAALCSEDCFVPRNDVVQ